MPSSLRWSTRFNKDDSGEARESIGVKLREPLPEPVSAPTTQRVRSRVSFNYVTHNMPSGTKYRFAPNAVLDVLAEDVPALLAISKRGGGCCGHAVKELFYFETVQE